jgi:hypothetical protein
MSAKAKFWVATIVVILTGLLLISGSSLITLPLVMEPYIPFGNVMSWFGLICFPLSLLLYLALYANLGRVLEVLYGLVLRLAILAGFAWPFVGKYLSGNWANSFVDRSEESALFWMYTEYTVLVSLIILILITIQVLLQRFVFKKPKEEESFY